MSVWSRTLSRKTYRVACWPTVAILLALGCQSIETEHESGIRVPKAEPEALTVDQRADGPYGRRIQSVQITNLTVIKDRDLVRIKLQTKKDLLLTPRMIKEDLTSFYLVHGIRAIVRYREIRGGSVEVVFRLSGAPEERGNRKAPLPERGT